MPPGPSLLQLPDEALTHIIRHLVNGWNEGVLCSESFGREIRTSTAFIFCRLHPRLFNLLRRIFDSAHVFGDLNTDFLQGKLFSPFLRHVIWSNTCEDPCCRLRFMKALADNHTPLSSLALFALFGECFSSTLSSVMNSSANTLQFLKISGSKILSVPRLSDNSRPHHDGILIDVLSGGMRNLKTLSLSYINISEEDLLKLLNAANRDLLNLKMDVLGPVKITDSMLIRITQILPCLEFFELNGGDQCTPTGVQDFIIALGSSLSCFLFSGPYRGINRSHQPISSSNIAQIAALCPVLRHFNMWLGDDLRSINKIDDIAPLGPQLKSVQISGGENFGSTEMSMLLKYLPHLAELRLCSPVDEELITGICGTVGLQLRLLRLCCDINESLDNIYRIVSCCENLRMLCISGYVEGSADRGGPSCESLGYLLRGIGRNLRRLSLEVFYGADSMKCKWDDHVWDTHYREAHITGPKLANLLWNCSKDLHFLHLEGIEPREKSKKAEFKSALKKLKQRMPSLSLYVEEEDVPSWINEQWDTGSILYGSTLRA